MRLSLCCARRRGRGSTGVPSGGSRGPGSAAGPGHPLLPQRGRNAHCLCDCWIRTALSKGRQLAEPFGIRLGEPGLEALLQGTGQCASTHPLRRTRQRAVFLGRVRLQPGPPSRGSRSGGRHPGAGAIPAFGVIPRLRQVHRFCGTPSRARNETDSLGWIRARLAASG